MNCIQFHVVLQTACRVGCHHVELVISLPPETKKIVGRVAPYALLMVQRLFQLEVHVELKDQAAKRRIVGVASFFVTPCEEMESVKAQGSELAQHIFARKGAFLVLALIRASEHRVPAFAN